MAVLATVAAMTLSPLAVSGAAHAAIPAAQGSDSGPGADAASGSAHHLSVRLAALLRARAKQQSASSTARSLSVPVAGAGSLLRSPGGSQLLVAIRLATYDDAAVARVEAAGAQIIDTSPDQSVVTAAVSARDLPAVGDVGGVEYVSEMLAPQVRGVCDTTKSEGDTLLGAAAVRSTRGLDGSGVRVGVLSDTFSRAFGPTTTARQDVESDNLPGAANTCGHTSDVVVGSQPASGQDEGRAMAQTIHDLAPGAALSFATAVTGERIFARNIDGLVAQGAQVIVDDISYLDEPMYQDGVVAQAVTRARAAGVDYFTAAGNDRYNLGGHEVGSYEAVDGYRPTPCPDVVLNYFDEVDCHNFNTTGAADPTFGYTSAGDIPVVPILNWAEPAGGVTTDLDLFLVDETTDAVVASGSDLNVSRFGSQKPFEYFNFQPDSSNATHTYSVVVGRSRSSKPLTTPRFKMIFAENGQRPFASLEHLTASAPDVMGDTSFGHATSPDAVAVGASGVYASPATLEDYSSYGTATALFGPVVAKVPAAALAAPRMTAKPDLVASDCGVTTFFAAQDSSENWRFCGTSQAAPHAAAVAALLRQLRPTASSDELNAAMATSARPLVATPASFQGAGLIDASAAADLISPPAVTPPAVTPALVPDSSQPQALPPPDTVITRAPRAKTKIKRHKRKTTVEFSFSSSVSGSTFTCTLSGKAATPCGTTAAYKLKPGTYTFSVAASTFGSADQSPATFQFKVKRKHGRGKGHGHGTGHSRPHHR